MKHSFIWLRLAIVIAVATSATINVRVAVAQSAAGFKMMSGTITAITDSSISLEGDDRHDFTCRIADGAFITVDRKPAKIADLQPGQEARVAMADGAANAIYARTVSITASGKILSIDHSQILILWTNMEKSTFAIAPITKFTLYGKQSAIAELRAGMIADLSIVNNALIQVAVQKPDNALITGSISTISASSITVDRHLDDSVSYSIDDATSISLNGRPAKLADLHMGQQVQVTSDDGTTAHTIAASTSSTHGQSHHNGEGS